MKKIYIMTDMEGVSGIHNQAQTVSGTPEYQAARSLLHADVNAAIAGAFDGGAQEVVVCDGHGTGFNFRIEQLDPRACYERPAGAANIMPSLDSSFSGLFCIGYHAMAGTLNGFLDHTQSSAHIFNCFVNGRRSGELAQVAAWAGTLGVPILLVSGDQAACDEARDFFGEIQTVAVKQGMGRQYARCLHPTRGCSLIRDAAARATASSANGCPFQLEFPLTTRVEFYRSDMADAACRHSSVRRIDARTVEHTTDRIREMLLVF